MEDVYRFRRELREWDRLTVQLLSTILVKCTEVRETRKRHSNIMKDVYRFKKE